MEIIFFIIFIFLILSLPFIIPFLIIIKATKKYDIVINNNYNKNKKYCKNCIWYKSHWHRGYFNSGFVKGCILKIIEQNPITGQNNDYVLLDLIDMEDETNKSNNCKYYNLSKDEILKFYE